MGHDALVKSVKERMEKALKHTQDQLRNIRTSRASPGLVEHVRVEYYGSPTPLSQIAQISIPEPRQIMIKPFDGSILEGISKAIMKSDVGITPESDGKVIRLNLPPLSGDQRKKYAAKAKEIAEEGRVSIRNVRRDANKEADALEKSGGITQDQNHALHEEIQKLLKDYENKVAALQDQKTHEILEV